MAESFERIHRSNLIGMGILPLQFRTGENPQSLGLTGLETYDIVGIAENLKPGKEITVKARSSTGKLTQFAVIIRIDTPNEIDYYKNDGILQYVLRSMMKR
jgi:aconitate hydratase